MFPTAIRNIVNKLVLIAALAVAAARCPAQTSVELQPATITGTIQISEPLYSNSSSVRAVNVADNSVTSAQLSGNTYSIIVPSGKTYRLEFYLYVGPSSYLWVRPGDQVAVGVNETVTKNYTYTSTRITGSVAVTGGTFVSFSYLQHNGSSGSLYYTGYASNSNSVPTLTSVTTSVYGTATINNGSANMNVSLPNQNIAVGTSPANASWTISAASTGSVQGTVSVVGPTPFSYADIWFGNVYKRMTENGSFEFSNVPTGNYGNYGYFYFPDAFFGLYRNGTVTAGNATVINYATDFTSSTMSLGLSGFLTTAKINYGYMQGNRTTGNDYLIAYFKPQTASFGPFVPLGTWRFPYVYVQSVDQSDPQNAGYITISKYDYQRDSLPITFDASGGTVPAFSLNVAQTELIFDVIEPAGSAQETLISNPQINGSATTRNAAGATISYANISAYSYSTNRAKPKLKIMGEPGTYTIQPSARIGNQNVNFGSFQLTLELPLLTPVGTDVIVEPIPDVWLQFDQVTAVGVTTASILPSGPQLPAGRSALKRNNVAKYYNISTTALFNGSVEVTITYDPAEITAEQEANLKIFHYDEAAAQWIDITIAVDTVNNRITGVTPGFSLFVVAYTNAPVITQLNAPGGQRGAPVAFTAQFTDADVSDQHTATWNWGDGSSATTATVTPGSISASHTFAQRGTFSGSLTITDATNNSATRPFSVTVTGVPVANSQAVSVTEDVAKAITLTGTDAVTFNVLSQPQHGTLTGSAPNLTYTPHANYNGSDSFTFKVNDGTVDSAAATVSISVTPINDAPSADAQTVVTDEDVAKAITLGGSDGDNDTLTFAIVNGPTNGVLTGSGANRTYTPNHEFNGTDSFTFTVSDASLTSAPATVSITVTAVNDAPIALDQPVTTAEDTAKAITLSGSDTEGAGLTFTVVNAPGHGTLTGTAPNLTYTPASNYNGPDSFTFKVSDGSLDSATNGTVSITVTAVNDTSVATAQSVTTAEDTAKPITLAGSDVDGDALTYAVVAPPAHGILSGSGASLTYTPASNYNGSDSFTFKVNDGTVDSAVATVNISVTPVNDAPVLTAIGNKPINEQTQLSFALSASDVDVGDSLTYSAVAPIPEGLAVSAAGQVTWTPSELQGGAPSTTYTVKFRATDNGGLTSEQSAAITVYEVNRAPSLTKPDNQSLPWNNTVSFTLDGTDPDLPANALAYSISSGTQAGMQINATTGAFSWTPTSGQIGGYNVTFRVTDGGGLFADQSVTITVGKRATTLIYGGHVAAQYSDKPLLKATLTDTLTSAGIASKTISFTIGTQTTTAGTDGSGVASTNTYALTQAPNTYTVASSFIGDDFYLPANDSDSFAINPESASPIVYAGGTYFSTANSSSVTATVALTASATDHSDGTRGDIQKGKLEFRRDTAAGSLLGDGLLPIGLVNALDLTVGTATTPSFTYTLQGSEVTNNGASLTVYTAAKGWYTGSSDPEVITITVPGSENVSGGGYLLLSSSAGQYAGTPGSKCNFGLTVKYNRSGKNLQGQVNIIIRSAGRIFQIKSNAIDSLATTGTGYPQQATIVTKANLADITDPLAPVSLGGNLSLQVQMIDNGTGGATDQVAIALSNSAGGLLFSSNWTGTKTDPQTIAGGNLSVR